MSDPRTTRQGEDQTAPATRALARYFTAGQVAAQLQISPKSVFRWAAEDPTMPVLRIGRMLRFPADRLEAWLRAREQGRGRPRLVAAKGEAREAAGR